MACMLKQVANPIVNFNLKKNIIFPIFHGHKNMQFNNLSYFGKLQILGCYMEFLGLKIKCIFSIVPVGNLEKERKCFSVENTHRTLSAEAPDAGPSVRCPVRA